MSDNRYYTTNFTSISRFINLWDLVLLVLIFSVLFFLSWAGKQMATPYQLGEQIAISLDPGKLPVYALYTISRMFVALFISLIFTFVVGAMAAKYKRAEQIIIPTIDILQSVPVLSFLSITITGFIALFPGSLLGPECACIFVIFTAQVWNMTFGFYQSLKTLPTDLLEAAAMFQLSPWQRFWKIEVPHSMSSLLWNMMISMSASWFFVVLSETISVAHQNIRLPGIGSYIALAIEQRNMHALVYAIITMIIVIFLYDQILFRPLVAWSEKFKPEETPDEEIYNSWLIDIIRKSQLLRHTSGFFNGFKEKFIHTSFLQGNGPKAMSEVDFKHKKIKDLLWSSFILIAICIGSWYLINYIMTELRIKNILHVFFLGSITATRVVVLIVLSSLVWVPAGVWIGLRPHLSQRIQPIIQFVAAFPANLFYPLFVIAIVRFNLNVEIWLTPLMILGTQWYILFNVIAGASRIPRELYLAADNFGLQGWLWWKRLALPAVFPYFITGAITAAGGAWNASIVAEAVSWGNTNLRATGLGEYIQESTINGDFPQIALGTAVMCLFVLLFNHLIWRPLYRLAEERFNLN